MFSLSDGADTSPYIVPVEHEENGSADRRLGLEGGAGATELAFRVRRVRIYMSRLMDRYSYENICIFRER